MGKYVVSTQKTGFNFQLKAGNGEPIMTSEIYATKKACLKGIESVRSNAPVAKLEDQTLKDFKDEKNPKFVIYKDKAEKVRFYLTAKNGEKIGASEPYNSKQSCKNGIDSVIRNAPSVVID